MSALSLVPRISEKAIGLAENGTYVFEVPADANKIEVARAVKQEFKVDVARVNMLITKGKPASKRYGKNAGTRVDVKKALVTVKKGQKIALFEEGGN